jgi:DNA-binding transcriptional MerR regulator
MGAGTEAKAMRIGEVAELTGLTSRTIRYYEEIGLFTCADQREQGKHRLYTTEDVEQIQELVRLRDLLGLSLEQLSELVEAEAARAEIRREIAETDDPGRKRELVNEALGHIGTQLRLVRERQAELAKLEQHLLERQQAGLAKLEALGA